MFHVIYHLASPVVASGVSYSESPGRGTCERLGCRLRDCPSPLETVYPKLSSCHWAELYHSHIPTVASLVTLLVFMTLRNQVARLFILAVVHLCMLLCGLIDQLLLLPGACCGRVCTSCTLVPRKSLS